MEKNQIILASSSPRRIEMMKENGFNPILIPPQIEESIPKGAGPKDAVLFLALKKALSTEDAAKQAGYNSGETIIAADTIVYNNNIIGKPENRENAFQILKELCGKKHQVMTGVAILKAGAPEREVFCVTTDVYFKNYSDEEINAYIDTDEPYDKAGGYAIQGLFGKNVDRIEGSYENVIGFPWAEIQKRL